MFRHAGQTRLGVLTGDRVMDLNELADAAHEPGFPVDLVEFIAAGPETLRRASQLLGHTEASTRVERRPLDGLRILPPLNPPAGNVLAIGRNYAEHARESAKASGSPLQPPTVFTKAQTSVIGPADDIPLDPAVSTQMDWEVELGVVIGLRALNLRREAAADYIFGYTVVNDISARDIQYGWGGQFFKGKSLDGSCPTGPWIVTADEVADPQNLELRLRLNGETKQADNTRNMIFPVVDLIAELSTGMTLPPGALIATGTPAGVGGAREPKEFLKDGDVVETEVVGIGMLRNRVVEVHRA